METVLRSDCGVLGTGLPMSLVQLVSLENKLAVENQSLIGLCFPKENDQFSSSSLVNLTFEPLSWTNNT